MGTRSERYRGQVIMEAKHEFEAVDAREVEDAKRQAEREAKQSEFVESSKEQREGK